MKDNHTPGPWKVHNHSHFNKEQWLSTLHGAFDLTHNGAGNPAVIACSKYSAMTDEENLSNARLITAAANSYDKHCGDRAVECAEGDLLGEMIANLNKIKLIARDIITHCSSPRTMQSIQEIHNITMNYPSKQRR